MPLAAIAFGYFLSISHSRPCWHSRAFGADVSGPRLPLFLWNADMFGGSWGLASWTPQEPAFSGFGTWVRFAEPPKLKKPQAHVGPQTTPRRRPKSQSRPCVRLRRCSGQIHDVRHHFLGFRLRLKSRNTASQLITGTRTPKRFSGVCR